MSASAARPACGPTGPPGRWHTCPLRRPGPSTGAALVARSWLILMVMMSAAVLLGGWLTTTAVIAGHGWYHTRLSQVPWLPVAAAGFLGTLLALSRIPVVARALTAPGMASRLVRPHSFRGGRGGLPALPGPRSPARAVRPARRLAQGTGRRAAQWFNAFGITDLIVALTLGALSGYQLLNVTPSSAPIGELPLALIRQPPCRCCSPCTSRPRSRPPEPHDQRRQPPARSFPAPRRALLWRQARDPAPGERTQRRGEHNAARDRRAQGCGGLAGRRPAHPGRARQPAHGRGALPGPTTRRELGELG